MHPHDSYTQQPLNILVVCCSPFGFITDAVELVKHVGCRHAVTVISLGRGPMDGASDTVPHAVRHSVVDRSSHVLCRIWKWLDACARACREDYDIVYLYYFPMCSLLRCVNARRRFILDIRSGAVSGSWMRRGVRNLLISAEARAFGRISVLCDAMRRYLRLPRERTHICPLGANPIPILTRDMSCLRLLYVGTFLNRRLSEAIKGFAIYCREEGASTDAHFTLVGDSEDGERHRLQMLVHELGLTDRIALPGYVPRERLTSYYECCNVGVSYVPMTPYYDCQPPTKTYEYFFAGMPVIATATKQNAVIVSDDNGVLIDDTPDAFCSGLRVLAQRLRLYDSGKILSSVSDHSWYNIMTNNALPFIEAVALAHEE